MGVVIKNTSGTVIGRIMKADKTMGRARILKTVGELGAEYILSEILSEMGVKEGEKVDIKKITDKRGRLFMEVIKKP